MERIDTFTLINLGGIIKDLRRSVGDVREPKPPMAFCNRFTVHLALNALEWLDANSSEITAFVEQRMAEQPDAN